MEVELLDAHDGHEGVEDEELAGCESSDHHTPGAEPGGAELHEASLLGDVHEPGDHAAIATGTLLVDLRKQRVGRVGDDGRSDARDEAGGHGHAHLAAPAQVLALRGQGVVDADLRRTLDRELGHGVWDLLEEDRHKPCVPAHDALPLDQCLHGREGAFREGGVGDLSNAGSLQRAKEDVSDELRAGRGSQHDRSPHVPCLLVSEGFGELDFEELVATELEPALHEVAGRRGPKPRGQHTRTLLGHNLAPDAQEPTLVLHWVQLDAGLHHVHRAKRTVRDGAADPAAERAVQVVLRVILRPVVSGHGQGCKGLMFWPPCRGGSSSSIKLKPSFHRQTCLASMPTKEDAQELTQNLRYVHFAIEKLALAQHRLNS